MSSHSESLRTYPPTDRLKKNMSRRQLLKLGMGLSVVAITPPLIKTAEIIADLPMWYEKETWRNDEFAGITQQEFTYHQNMYTERPAAHLVQIPPHDERVLTSHVFTLSEKTDLFCRLKADIEPGKDYRHTITASLISLKNEDKSVTYLAPLVRSDDNNSAAFDLGSIAPGSYRLDIANDQTTRSPLTADVLSAVSMITVKIDSLWSHMQSYSPIIAVDLRHTDDVSNNGMLALFSTVTKNSKGDYLIGYQAIFSGQRGGTPLKTHRETYGNDIDSEWVSAVQLSPDFTMQNMWYQAKHHQRKEFNGYTIDTHPVLQIDYGNNNFNSEVRSSKFIRVMTDVQPSEVNVTEYLRKHPSFLRIATQELIAEGKADEYGNIK